MYSYEVELDHTADLSNQTFQLYKLGPIYEFRKTTATNKEKTLAAQLCQNLKLHDGRQITRTQKQKDADNVLQGDLRRLHIDPINLPEIKSYDSEIKPLRFTIEILQFKDDRLTEHTFYMLPSPTVPQNEKKPEAFEYYPLVLIKATNQIKQEIIAWFDKRYIATCTPLFMYPATMVDSVDIWIDSILDLQEKLRVFASVPDQMLRPPLTLEYTTGDENLSTITVKISRPQALEICKRMSDPRQFLRTFEAHVENTAHFRLNTLTLYQVTSSVANVRKDGHVKISPHAYKSFAIRLLQSWVDLAVEKVFPNIGS